MSDHYNSSVLVPRAVSKSNCCFTIVLALRNEISKLKEEAYKADIDTQEQRFNYNIFCGWFLCC